LSDDGFVGDAVILPLSALKLYSPEGQFGAFPGQQASDGGLFALPQNAINRGFLPHSADFWLHIDEHAGQM
jgi:hypothetical protein